MTAPTQAELAALYIAGRSPTTSQIRALQQQHGAIEAGRIMAAARAQARSDAQTWTPVEDQSDYVQPRRARNAAGG